MRLSLVHARAMTVELLRYPAYLVPTLLLPTVFFLFFVAPGSRVAATARMATFAGFAVIGVAFFQFGVGIAIDRASPWEAYLRTLPGRTAGAARGPARLGCDLRLRRRARCSSSRRSARAARRSSAAGWAELIAALARGHGALCVSRHRTRLLGAAEGRASDREPPLSRPRLRGRPLDHGPSSLPRAVAGVSRYLPTRAYADALVAAAIGLGVAGAPGSSSRSSP